MANNPVAWFEIYVDDMDRASKFYGEVLAVEFELLGDPDDSPRTWSNTVLLARLSKWKVLMLAAMVL